MAHPGALMHPAITVVASSLETVLLQAGSRHHVWSKLRSARPAGQPARSNWNAAVCQRATCVTTVRLQAWLL